MMQAAAGGKFFLIKITSATLSPLAVFFILAMMQAAAGGKFFLIKITSATLSPLAVLFVLAMMQAAAGGKFFLIKITSATLSPLAVLFVLAMMQAAAGGKFFLIKITSATLSPLAVLFVLAMMQAVAGGKFFLIKITSATLSPLAVLSSSLHYHLSQSYHLRHIVTISCENGSPLFIYNLFFVLDSCAKPLSQDAEARRCKHPPETLSQIHKWILLLYTCKKQSFFVIKVYFCSILTTKKFCSNIVVLWFV